MSVSLKGPWSADQISEFLHDSVFPVRLACVGADGFPRVVSVWFQYIQGQFICASHQDSQLVAMLFCHLGRCRPLPEICNGLACCCVGKLVHIGVGVDEPLLATITAASVQVQIATGERTGRLEHVAFSLKSVWSDGTYQIVLSPEELLEKLAALGRY